MIGDNKFKKGVVKISQAHKKKWEYFSFLAINYPRNSILYPFTSNCRFEAFVIYECKDWWAKNLFFTAHKYSTDKSESEGYKPLFEKFVTDLWVYHSTRSIIMNPWCWGFLSSHLPRLANYLFTLYIYDVQQLIIKVTPWVVLYSLV